jgi:hypothetical protein
MFTFMPGIELKTLLWYLTIQLLSYIHWTYKCMPTAIKAAGIKKTEAPRRRRLKCELWTDAKWWQKLTWPFMPGELKHWLNKQLYLDSAIFSTFKFAMFTACTKRTMSIVDINDVIAKWLPLCQHQLWIIDTYKTLSINFIFTAFFIIWFVV